VLRFDQPIEEARNEPLFLPHPGEAPRLRLSASPTPIADDIPADRSEPAFPVAEQRPTGSAALPDRERPVESEPRRRPFGPIVSLVLHLLPLLLLIDWPMHPPAEVTPIPVQLVFQPPPSPPPIPKPAPKPRPETRRPPGRLASADMGDTKTKGQDQAKSEEPSPNKEPPATMESQFERAPKLASINPPPLLPAPAEIMPPQPMDMFAPKPSPKLAPAVHQAVARAPQRAHLMPRSGRFPGPSATRDEYLAYVNSLILRHLGLLSHSLIAGRRGETAILMLVLDDGTVARVSVMRSSGYTDIDLRVEEMVRAAGRFPPLPQWIQGPSTGLVFAFPFPGGLED
jgi:periplasmic protein TonB